MMPLLKPEERSPTIILTKNAGQCVPVLDLLAGDGPSALDLLAGDGPSVLDLLVDLEDCRRAEVGPVSIKIPVHVLVLLPVMTFHALIFLIRNIILIQIYSVAGRKVHGDSKACVKARGNLK